MCPSKMQRLALGLGLAIASIVVQGCSKHNPYSQRSIAKSRSEEHRNISQAKFTRQTAASSQSRCCSSIEIHYSPGENLERIDVELLKTAHREIDMSVYSLTDREIGDTLEEMAKNGVQIKIYSDHESAIAEIAHGRGREPLILELGETPNVEVRIKHSSTLAHMKAFEVDGRVLRTGSANFSPGAEKKQDNDLVIIDNPALVALYRAKFEEMWNRSDNESIR